MQGISLGVLFVIGLGIFGGVIGAWIFQRLRIPQVVGYIAVGLIIGETGFHFVTQEDVRMLRPFSLFALGIIGFLVGGELKLAEFRKYARQFAAMLLGEGVAAFSLVGVMTGLVAYTAVHDVATAVAIGVVFGAIASATDPASTIDVLWEYRARGVLTTSITAIVALDDALAMMLYGLGTSLAQLLTTGSGSIAGEMAKVSMELLGAGVLGFALAMLLVGVLRVLHEPEKTVSMAVGVILLSICIAQAFDMDVILVTMTLGFTLVNMAPRRSMELFRLMRSFSTPIYVLFFVLVGARLSLARMPGWLLLIVFLYVIGRSVGKMGGAYWGARLTGSEASVRKYLGMGLFAQGGVAVGLSIMASQRLGNIQVNDDLALGDVVIFTVAATTLIVQIIGPPMVKLAIKLGGEIGRNVTEEDVIASWTVADVMDTDIEPINEGMPLRRVIQVFVDNVYTTYPVVNLGNQTVGTVSLEGLKDVIAEQDTWEWLLVSDIMQPLQDKASPKQPLIEALIQMRELQIDEMPVVADDSGGSPAGMLNQIRIRKRLSEELVRRQQPERFSIVSA